MNTGTWIRRLPVAVAVLALAHFACGSGSAADGDRPATATDTRWRLTMPMVMSAIHDRRIRVGPRRVSINTETVLCSGEGAPARRQPLARWSRFSCRFTTFTRRGVGRDVSFEVLVRGPDRIAIRGARWVEDARQRAADVLGSRTSNVGPESRDPMLLIVLAAAILLLAAGALPRQVVPHPATATFIARRRVAFAVAGLTALAAFIVSYFVT